MQPLLPHGTSWNAPGVLCYPTNSEAALHLLVVEAREFTGEVSYVSTA
jgi:hypothetical protein